ncbi:hypothetical protein [Nonomuraea jabiensis]|uniref:hypothetical protein n=1 Tax=Nonomuraea jabiensis TaxID=882448 RepID=UPI003D7554C0
MASVANAGQEAVWNGEEGRRWADHHQRLDRMAEPVKEHLFGVDAGDRSAHRR